MKQVLLPLLVFCSVGFAMTRYIAIPIEENTDLNELVRLRMPREVETIGVIRGARGTSHSNTNGEYVDFGAHTGQRGSYGWYADFPVHRQV